MIDLARLPQEGMRLEGRLAQLPLEGQEGLRDLDFTVLAMPSGADVFLDVKGRGVWEGVCSRCLEPFDRHLEVGSQFLGSKDPDLVARGSHTLGTQDLDVVFLPEPLLDEEALVREQFQLQVPMSPLCREDCQGLCPSCGKNWNKGKCACHPERLKEPSALAKALSGLKLNLEP
ncbi:MAG: DUF177 domain-containing protein [Acidobacteria bacterium]|nr:DUF177 domain-containing protein [Acidobacteriota bacterium]